MIEVTEYNLSTGEPTGVVMGFVNQADVLYTARLSNGRAQIGATGKVVYPDGVLGYKAWVCRPMKG